MGHKKEDIERAIRIIRKALEGREPLYLVASDGNEIAAIMAGEPVEISRTLSIAMERDMRFLMAAELAVTVNKTASQELNMQNEGLLDLLKKLKNTFTEARGHEPLDCDNCDLKDDCDIRDFKPTKITSCYGKTFKA